MFDRGFSALLADLHERGLLDIDPGRRDGRVRPDPQGRPDHQQRRGRQGGSRPLAALLHRACSPAAASPPAPSTAPATRTPPIPARDPVTPQDIAATIYQAMGLDPETSIRDPLDRPHALSTGTPIGAAGMSAVPLVPLTKGTTIGRCPALMPELAFPFDHMPGGHRVPSHALRDPR